MGFVRRVRIISLQSLQGTRSRDEGDKRMERSKPSSHLASAVEWLPWEAKPPAVKAPGVQKNATPSLTQRQAIALLEAIPTDSVQGIRDLALMSVFFAVSWRIPGMVKH